MEDLERFLQGNPSPEERERGKRAEPGGQGGSCSGLAGCRSRNSARSSRFVVDLRTQSSTEQSIGPEHRAQANTKPGRAMNRKPGSVLRALCFVLYAPCSVLSLVPRSARSALDL
jgi:hypothetical protein